MTRFPLTMGPLLAGLFLSQSACAEEIDIHDLATLSADVVILGAVHDNPAHHVNQATAVAALQPAALVFEVLEPSDALRATPAARRNARALSKALKWDDSGWPDFSMYYPIFVAAPDAAVFGGDLAREVVRRAVRDGAAAAFGAGAELFGLTTPLYPEEQRTREARRQAAHCNAIADELLPGMVEAQRLRDAALARAVVAAIAETGGGPVTVIAGNSHARTDWGLPRMITRALPDATVLSVGQLEGPPTTPPPHDVWLVTPPAQRQDRCAVLLE
ncbi:MAG: ChaN family lipoprotein [Pseudomonadota bacterium]